MEGSRVFAERRVKFSRPLPIFCMFILLENFDADIRDCFVESVDESKFLKLKSLLTNGSNIETYEWIAGMSTYNSNGKDIKKI